MSAERPSDPDSGSVTQRVVGDSNTIVGSVQGDVFFGDQTIIQNVIRKVDRLTTSPYKFLASYGIEDRDIFFGRDLVTDELSALVARHRLVIVSGASGSGKSSLVNAGLLPRLVDNGYVFLDFREYSHPRKQLARYLRESGKEPVAGSGAPESWPLAEAFRAFRTANQNRLVVVFDQFERFLVNVSAANRLDFIEQLSLCLEEFPLAELGLVFVLRQEFLGQLLAELEARHAIFATQAVRYHLGPLGLAEAREAILRPLEHVEAKIDYDRDFVDSVLLDGLQGSDADQPGAVQPPQLQIVCHQLYSAAYQEWKRDGGVFQIDAAFYHAMGGAESLINRYLDNAVLEVAGSEANVPSIRSILKHMVDASGTRKFVSLEDLAAELPGLKEDLILHQVERLAERRVVELRDGTASLSHEYMVSEVSSWFDEREFHIKQARELLERALVDWKNSNALLNGKQIEIVRAWRPDLTQDEKVLVVASETAIADARAREEAQERRIRQRNWLVQVASVFLLVTAVVSILLWLRALSAEEQALGASRNFEASAVGAAARELSRQVGEAETADLRARVAAQALLMAMRSDSLAGRPPNSSFHQAVRTEVYSSLADQSVTRARAGYTFGRSSLYQATYLGHKVFSPDGRWLLIGWSVFDSGELSLLDLRLDDPWESAVTFKAVALQGSSRLLSALSNRHLLVTVKKETVLLMDLESGQWRELFSVDKPGVDQWSPSDIQDVAASPDGRWFAVAADSLRIFDSAGSQVNVLAPSMRVTFDPGSRRLAIMREGRITVMSAPFGPGSSVVELSPVASLYRDLFTFDATGSRLLAHSDRDAEEPGALQAVVWSMTQGTPKLVAYAADTYAPELTLPRFSPDGTWLQTVAGRRFQLVDLSDGQTRLLAARFDALSGRLQFDPADRFAWYVPDTWEPPVWIPLRESAPPATEFWMAGPELVPPGPQLTWIPGQGYLRLIWDASTEQDPYTRSLQEARVTGRLFDAQLPGSRRETEFSPDGRWIVSNAFEMNRLWRVDELMASPLQPAHGPEFSRLLSTDTKWVMTWCMSCNGISGELVLLSDPDTRYAMETAEPIGQEDLGRLLVSPDGRWLVAGGFLWSRSGESEDVFRAHTDRGVFDFFAEFSGDSQHAVLSTTESRRTIFDLTESTPRILGTIPDSLQMVGWAPSGLEIKVRGSWGGKYILSVQQPNQPVLSDFGILGEECRTLLDGSSMPYLENPTRCRTLTSRMRPDAPELRLDGSFRLSPHGRWLAASRSIWDLDTPETARAYLSVPAPTETSQRFAVAGFSPDGRWALVSDSQSGVASACDLLQPGPGNCALLEGQSFLGFEPVLFSPDSRFLLTSNYGASGAGRIDVLLFNMDSIESVQRPVVLDATTPLGFSPDSRFVYTADPDRRDMARWPIRMVDLLEIACRASGRNLNEFEWNRYLAKWPYQSTCPQYPNGSIGEWDQLPTNPVMRASRQAVPESTPD